jgi:hypothetical protein
VNICCNRPCLDQYFGERQAVLFKGGIQALAREDRMVKNSRIATSAALVIGMPVCAVLLWASATLAAASPGESCAAAKQKAAGLKAHAKLSCYSTYTKSGGSSDLTACLQKADTKFEAAFQKAEAKTGNPQGCATTGDAAAIESLVDDFVAAVVAALPATPIPTSTPTAAPTATPLKSDGTTCTSSDECLNSQCLPDDSNTSSKVCCHTGCTASPLSSCGTDGNCAHDGSACTLYPASTQCRQPSCTDNPMSVSVSTAAAFCDGAGNCPMPVTEPCGNYVCHVAACGTFCASDSDCVAGTFCNTGLCM